ncbi:HIT domain-containing protein [Paenibacillus sp. H1-7]|uniref:HIT family protein n=1 Tax=Paenibacillus sp. H1-7 TaxID=2282849 RepID=UPI001EF7BE5F|nr:HIT domain-containing protein [Paenibacillus sp. H1-7]ULL19365.1 HIT domain-containing protein [Paenibacillus sp. H1-7]
MTEPCPFCEPLKSDEIVLESEYCVLITNKDKVLVGSCMIIPRAHRETVFDLTDEEFRDTRGLLLRAKAYLDERYKPDGYNVGWNSGAVGGQTVLHAHLHVIPRFKDEPFAGQGIRHHLKQEENRRP